MDGPDQPGVRCGERSSSYEELFSGALRATSALAALGVGAGDRVALLLRNSIEFLQASVATVPLGASAVPINWHWRGDEVAHVLADSRAKVLVVHDDLWPAVCDAVPEDVAVVLVAEQAGGTASAFLVARLTSASTRAGPELLSAHEPYSQAPESGPMSIIYTSGTTGRPKGVVRTPVSEEKRASRLGADRGDLPARRG